MRKGNSTRKHLNKTDDVEFVVELVLLSGYIKNTGPLSLILSAQVGAGKTEILKRLDSPKCEVMIKSSIMFGIPEVVCLVILFLLDTSSFSQPYTGNHPYNQG